MWEGLTKKMRQKKTKKNKNTSPSVFPGTRGRGPFPSARTGHSGKTNKKAHQALSKPSRPPTRLQQSPARTRRLCSRSRSRRRPHAPPLLALPLARLHTPAPRPPGPPPPAARPQTPPARPPPRRPPCPPRGQAPDAAHPAPPTARPRTPPARQHPARMCRRPPAPGAARPQTAHPKSDVRLQPGSHLPHPC